MGSSSSPGSDSGNVERGLDIAEPRNTNAHDRMKVSVLHGEGARAGTVNKDYGMVVAFSSGGDSVLKKTPWCVLY